MSDIRAAAERLIALARSGALDEVLERHGIAVMTLFGSATRHGVSPRDIDVAVVPNGEVDRVRLVADLVALIGDVDVDLVDLRHASIVLRAEALAGQPIFEDIDGRFVAAQASAFGEALDTEWLRRLDLELMAQ